MRILTILLASALLFSCGKGAKENSEKTNDLVEDTMQTVKQTTPASKYILFFGNSLTAGYGLDEDQSFPSLIQDRIDSLGLPYRVINGGLSGETSAGGLGRIDWVLRQQIDVFVLELGSNDMLRGLDLEETEKNLRGILDAVLAKYPDIPIIIAGMEAPPNLGPEYTAAFRKIFTTLAKEYRARLIPFLLEGVGGIPELNQQDRMHPNAEGAKVVRDNVWAVLKEVINKG